MGVATAVAAVAAGTAIYGAVSSSEGARRSSQAQDAANIDWMTQLQRSKQQALDAYSQYSPTQQATIDKAMASQQADLKRQESLVASINPALIEAGKQTQQLLQGQAAPVLQNLTNQRQLQRQNMLDSLRQQLGPGAETSSLGRNALQKFDSDTANIMSGAQQSYLQQVSGLALNGNATLGQSISQATSNLAKLGDSYGQIGLNKANIINGFQAQANEANKSNVAAAGNAGAAQALQGQGFSNLGNSLMQGAAIYGAYSNSGDGPSGTGLSSSQQDTVSQAKNLNGSSSLAMGNIGSQYSGGSGGGQYSLGTLGGSVTPTSRVASGGIGTYGQQSLVPNYGGHLME